MNHQRLASILSDRPEKYPYALEQAFPRILDRIMELWGTDAANQYFLDLLVDRRGDRKGFPYKVAEEVFFLSELHLLLNSSQAKIAPGAPTQAQFIARADAKTQEFVAALESRDIKFIPPDFFRCVSKGDLSSVVLFVNAGMDIDTPNEQGWTPLMVALFEGREEVALFLIKKGANVHAKDRSGYQPIHWAAFQGYTVVIDEIIARGGDVNAITDYGWSALLQATTLGHQPTVAVLLGYGADANGSDREGWAPLHKAASHNFADIALALLKAGAGRDARCPDGGTALHIAARLGHIEIADVFVTSGASQTIKDNDGALPLHHAAAKDQVAVLEQLIASRSHVSPLDHKGATPLVWAVRAGALNAARCLLKAGAHIRETMGREEFIPVASHAGGLGRVLAGAAGLLKSAEGLTRSANKLHRAVEKNDMTTAKRLLDKQVGYNARDADGRTALEIAAAQGKTDMWWLLVERGAGRVS